MKRLLALAAMIAAPALAAPCDPLTARLDELAKLTAKEDAESAYDESLPREQVRQIKIARYQTERNGIFMQMQSNGCKLPTSTDAESYRTHALRCRGNTYTTECTDLKNWKR